MMTSKRFCGLVVVVFITTMTIIANGMIYLSLLAMVAGITWIYMVASRVFMGFTPGEWVFDQRLGLPEALGTNSYALKAVARSTMVIATGGIVFPLLSLIFNRDLLGRLIGLELVKKA